jgi:hypothetical protein
MPSIRKRAAIRRIDPVCHGLGTGKQATVATKREEGGVA